MNQIQAILTAYCSHRGRMLYLYKLTSLILHSLRFYFLFNVLSVRFSVEESMFSLADTEQIVLPIAPPVTVHCCSLVRPECQVYQGQPQCRDVCWERAELQQACAASATLPMRQTKTELGRADRCKSQISSLVQVPFTGNELYLNYVT